MPLNELVRPTTNLLSYSQYYTEEQYRAVVFTPEMFGSKGDGLQDDTAAVQAAFTAAAAASKAVLTRLPALVEISRPHLIKGTLQLDAGRVRVRGRGPGAFILASDGVFTNNYAFNIFGGDTLVAYSAKSAAIFEGLCFFGTGRATNLWYAATSGSNSNNNGVCLRTVKDCSIRGINCVYTNGPGGWGWSWISCQFSDCNNLGNITHQVDTYERHTFLDCIWQGSGVAFLLNNSDGCIYWYGGSFDFCDGVADITAGFMYIQGHLEGIARTRSYIRLLGSTASVVLGVDVAVRQNLSTGTWYLCEQYQDYQLTVRDCVITTDGNNAANGLISNKAFRKAGVQLPSASAKLIGYFSCDEELLRDTSGHFTTALTNPSINSVGISGRVLTYKGLFGSGTTAYLNIDIPITGSNQMSFMAECSNSGAGAAVITKQILNANKEVIETITAGDASVAAGAANVRWGLRSVMDIPQTAAFLRLQVNGFYLSTSAEFKIHSLKMWLGQ